MMLALRRRTSTYGAIAAMSAKLMMAYNVWFWMEMLVQLLSMIILFFFWRAVYAGQGLVAGMEFQQTINYIMLAQIMAPLMTTGAIFHIGSRVADGSIANEFVRPIDFQSMVYIVTLADMLIGLLTKLPLLLIGVIFFGLQLPASLAVWGSFLVAMMLGYFALFCFDWLIGALSFYTTEVWGLGVMRFGVGIFFSGSLVPLTMMPGWLRGLVESLPFSQALYVPISFLSGITPAADAPRVWLTQLAWIALLLPLSRLVFKVAARKVTVQGG